MKCNTKFWDFHKTFTPDIDKVGVDSLDCISEKEWDQVAVRSFLAPFLEKTYKFDSLEDFERLLNTFLTFSESYVFDSNEYFFSGSNYNNAWAYEIFYDAFACKKGNFCLRIFYWLEIQKIEIEFAGQEIDDPDFPNDFPDLMLKFFEFCEVEHNANG